MENDKYFVPDIEALRIGYECEVNALATADRKENKWVSTCIRRIDHIERAEIALNLKYLRVSYLTKEQIEAEGWIPTTSSPNAHYKGNGYRFIHVWNDKPTSNSYIYYMGEGIFMGEIKSINEFRFICKLLKINKQ